MAFLSLCSAFSHENFWFSALLFLLWLCSMATFLAGLSITGKFSLSLSGRSLREY